MTLFYAYLEQEGGCDYTIACGRKLVEVPGVASIEEAKAWVVREYVDQIGCGNETELTRITLFEVARVTPLDLRAIAAAKHADMEAQREADKAEAERLEYERLKKKFE